MHSNFPRNSIDSGPFNSGQCNSWLFNSRLFNSRLFNSRQFNSTRTSPQITNTMADSNPANFANLPKDELREIAAKGGHASHGSNAQAEVSPTNKPEIILPTNPSYRTTPTATPMAPSPRAPSSQRNSAPRAAT
ncbi:hypothetical protein PMIN04_006610 [Paraphaeosphaeria minitans]